MNRRRPDAIIGVATVVATVTVAVAVAAAAVACAASGGLRTGSAVLAADSARIEAMVSANRAELEVTLHPSLTYTHSNGKLDTRETLIESLVGGDIDYLSIETIEPQVRLRGETAVLTSNVRMQVEAAGRVHDLEMAVTAVYFFAEGRWQLAAYQSVRLAD
jgi:hypothetical protein